MRLRLLLEAREAVTVPWDYRTYLTAAVYEILSAADPAYSNWLYKQGFRWGKRVYRLFVYSDLMPTHCRFSQDGLADVQWMTWQISSPDQQFLRKFLKGLEQEGWLLKLFGVPLEVVDVVRMEPLELKSGLVFHTISPIAVSVGDPSMSKHPIYLSPDQPGFAEALERNLITKWQAFHQREWNGADFGIRVWNPKRKLVQVFGTNVRAWHVHLQIWGPDELVRFAYDAGLGIKNSQGFGMIEPGV